MLPEVADKADVVQHPLMAGKARKKDQPRELDVLSYVSAVSALPWNKKHKVPLRVLVVYVDDLIFMGVRARIIFNMLSSLVRPDAPTPLDKFLGVYHSIHRGGGACFSGCRECAS